MWYVIGGLVLLVGGMLVWLMSGQSTIKEMQIADVDLSTVPDGVHEGSFKQGRWNYRVAVTVKDHKITRVELLSKRDKMFEKMYQTEFNRVLAAQSPNVDAFSGATVSSKALLKAIENALRK
ncbi:MAG TPA: FMN-binding protein [Firmicutes bacterium]|nr:FMN-binding protein [Candidatus Fermentithermobacillaceae bacterium]